LKHSKTGMKNKNSSLSLFAFYLLTSLTFFSACKSDETIEPIKLNRLTLDYFDLSSSSQWVFDKLLNGNESAATFSLLNKQKSVWKEANSELLLYDMEQDANLTWIVRCEAGSSDFANRIAFVVKKDGKQTIGASFLSQNNTFFNENSDQITKIGALTLNGINYNEVWSFVFAGNNEFKEIKIAKGYGLIYVKTKQNEEYTLKELKP